MINTSDGDNTEKQQSEPKAEQLEPTSSHAGTDTGLPQSHDVANDSPQVDSICDAAADQAEATPSNTVVGANAGPSAAMVESNIIPDRKEPELPRLPDADKPPSKCSERKIQSNQANAQKSTGPRTAQGKQRSAQNALKHGALAKTILFDADGKPRNEDLAMLWAQMCEEYDASSVRGRLQIESLLTAYRRNLVTIELENHLHKRGAGACLGPEAARVHRYGVANQRAMLSLLDELEEAKREQPVHGRTIDDAELESDQGTEQGEADQFDNSNSADSVAADESSDFQLPTTSTESHPDATTAGPSTANPASTREEQISDVGSEPASRDSDPPITEERDTDEEPNTDEH